jgi:hypothetical protein
MQHDRRGRRWLPPGLMVSLLFGCMATEPAVPVSEPEPEGEEYFFAVLGQSGVEHCPDGTHETTWLNVKPTLGFVSADGTAQENLFDQPVLARGTSTDAPKRAPIDAQPCPPMQMRSDWVNTPRGIRVQRTPTPNIEHFHMTSVRRLDELAVSRDGEEMVVSFRNPLPFLLVDVRLVVHYEGCY